MEKRNAPPAALYRKGLMESLLRRRDPGGDALFDPEDEAPETEGENESFTSAHP